MHARQPDSLDQQSSVAFHANEFASASSKGVSQGMCGIFAVLPAAVPARPLDLSRIIYTIERLRLPTLRGTPADVGALKHVQTQLTAANSVLSDPRAELRLLTDYSCVRRLRLAITRLERAVTRSEHKLDRLMTPDDGAERVAIQQGLIRVAAALWNLRHDRLSRVDSIGLLLGTADDGAGIAPGSAIMAYGAIETALRGLDRLEGPQRNIAGVHIWVRGPSLAEFVLERRSEIKERPQMYPYCVPIASGEAGIAFAYHASVANPQVGDNVAALREVIGNDGLFGAALGTFDVDVSVLAYSTGATFGTIDDDSTALSDQTYLDNDTSTRPYTAAVFSNTAQVPGRTYGANLVSTVANVLRSSEDPLTITVQSEREVDALVLGVHGEAHPMYVGFAANRWIVASEPYGLVGDADQYLSIGGHRHGGLPKSTVVRLRKHSAVDLGSVQRYGLDGKRVPIRASEVESTEITRMEPSSGFAVSIANGQRDPGSPLHP